jgi:hypothetical protein
VAQFVGKVTHRIASGYMGMVEVETNVMVYYGNTGKCVWSNSVKGVFKRKREVSNAVALQPST